MNKTLLMLIVTGFVHALSLSSAFANTLVTRCSGTDGNGHPAGVLLIEDNSGRLFAKAVVDDLIIPMHAPAIHNPHTVFAGEVTKFPCPMRTYGSTCSESYSDKSTAGRAFYMTVVEQFKPGFRSIERIANISGASTLSGLVCNP